MLCLTDYLPSQGDPAGRRKIKIQVYYETICITKITMVTKCLEDTTSAHGQLILYFLATHCNAYALNNRSSSIFINIWSLIK